MWVDSGPLEQGSSVGLIMTPSRVTIVLLATIAMSATSIEYAHAAPAGLTLVANDFSSPNYGAGPVTSGHTLEWDSRKGKWGLKLGVEQRSDRLGEWRDVQPGVYYKITPSLHIGGAVSLAPSPQINPRVAEPQLPAPRVKLETTFKF